MKLIKRTKIIKPDITYNLHVEKNNNYFANGVLVSNCHNLRGPVLKKIICDHAASIPYRFGVTGTLPKEPIDELAVKISVGQVKYEIPAHELISRGVLASLQIECIQLEEDLHSDYELYEKECKHQLTKPMSYKKFKQQYFPDYSAEKSYLQHKDSRIDWIANHVIKERDNSGNVLCFVTNIPTGRQLASKIPGSIFVNGQDVKDPKKRQEVYDMFETHNDLIVIATVHIAGTGLSINRIFTLFSIDLGKSFTRVIQAIGRGLRTSNDKQSVKFVDVCSDLKFGAKHLNDRIQYYNEAKYKYTKHIVKYDNGT